MTVQDVMTYAPVIGGMTLLFASGFAAGRMTGQWRKAYLFARDGWERARQDAGQWRTAFDALAADYTDLSVLYLTARAKLEGKL